MDLVSIFQSTLIAIGVLYLVAIIGMLIKVGLSGKILGLYLLIYPVLLFNTLFLQSTEIKMVAVIFSAPLMLYFTKVSFTEKVTGPDWVRLPLVPLLSVLAFLVKSPSIFLPILLLYLIIFTVKTRQVMLVQARLRGISLFRNPGSRIRWFRDFALIQLLVVILIIFHLYGPISSQAIPLLFLISLNIVLVYVQIFKESAFFNPIPSGQKYAKSSLTQEQKFSILNRTEDLMSANKLYMDPNISLTDLAATLHTTPHNLSQVLNEQKGLTFAEYVMQHRIDEAKRIIRADDQKQLKIEEVALQVGYHSKSAFNTAFKRFTNLTPSEFRGLKNVRDYREERLAGRTIHHYGKVSHNFEVYLNHFDMVRKFLIIFGRNFIRNKVFTAINMFGLILGFSSSLFIYLFIMDELSYDQSIGDAKDIYRVSWFGGNPQTRTPHPMAQAMVRDFPEVEQAVTLSPWYGSGLSKQKVTVRNAENNVQFEEPDFYFVDSTFLDVFDFKLISGNKETALKQPGGVILNQTMAEKYFGKDDPLGKRLYLSNAEYPAEVVGVIEDVPRATHFHYNFLISYVTLKAILPKDDPYVTWSDFGHFNYIKLQDGHNPQRLEQKLPEWFLGYNNWSGSVKANLLNGTNKFKLQRITDIHLHSNIRWELETNGNILYIYILTGAVIFILTIASINYINLTSAKSFERAKEIGIRKTLGALKGQLTFQFLIESVLFCFIASAVALVLVWILLPEFNHLSGKSFAGFDLMDPKLLFKGIIGILVIGIITGFYPSLALSSFKITEIIKGNFVRSRKGGGIGRILVISQFVISTILISASIVVLKQTNFLKEKPLGFDQNFLVSVPIKIDQDRSKHMVMIDEFVKIPGVLGATTISNVPGGQFDQNSIWTTVNPDNTVSVSEMTFDYNTIETLGLEIVSGRNFEKGFAIDSAGRSFILNEAAVKQLNLKEPLGEKIVWNLEEGDLEGYVIGVVKDFHFKSLHQTIQPVLIDMKQSSPGHFLIRINGNDIPSTTEAIKNVYKEIDIKHDFEYTFLDQSIDALYNAEVRTLNIFGIFSMIALFLACLGLLGIAISIMNQKIKEVGIRKIHGASSAQILWMVNRKFSKLIFLALLIGLPLAYLFSRNWIAAFPYQVEIGIFPFLNAVFVLFGVALLTTSFAVMKVAMTNPAEALRSE